MAVSVALLLLGVALSRRRLLALALRRMLRRCVEVQEAFLQVDVPKDGKTVFGDHFFRFVSCPC